jgi:Uma2 family endonuclease
MHEWPRRHRITVEHFYRMGEAGLFGANERVELINGEIIDVPPMGSRHAGSLEQLASALAAAVGTRAIVRQQLPLRLGEDSEPQPDIVVATTRADHYKASHPTAADVLLLVEISDSTLRYDREIKVGLYAHHEVPEVWVVDLQGKQVHCYRSPVRGQYATVATVELGRLSLAGLAGVAVDLAPLGA